MQDTGHTSKSVSARAHGYFNFLFGSISSSFSLYDEKGERQGGNCACSENDHHEQKNKENFGRFIFSIKYSVLNFRLP